MNDEMTVEEWAQMWKMLLHRFVLIWSCQLNFIYQPDKNGKAWKAAAHAYAMQQPFVTLNRYIANR